LRIEARALGDAAGHDGGNRRGEGQQEEELDQVVAILCRQHLGARIEADAVGDAVADEEIGDGGDRKIGEDLDQGVDLVLLAHRAEFEKGKPRVHGQHHDAAQQNEQNITT
jgi:hypothetical protein